MKRIFILTMIATTVLAACGNQTSDAGEMPTLRFGIMASVDAIPMVIAQEQGLFEAHGVNVELEFFANPATRDTAFHTGNLDGVMADLVAIGMYLESGFEVRATGVTSGRFTLVTYEELGSLEDMRGRSVATATNASPTFILDRMLASVGMTLDDIVIEEIPSVPTRLELVQNGQVDAAVLTDPFATIGQSEGAFALIHNTDIDFTPIITGFTQEFIDGHPEAIRHFYAAFDEASRQLNEGVTEETIDLIIEAIGFPAHLRENIQLPYFRDNHLPSDETLDLAIEWLVSRGLVTMDLNPQDLISTVAFD
ncbi:MAG: ABC transporter substrate-binding protein [Turicibacter sp.]|nr:ABC transporter substrate-binding protein [Turicibacter sp.]